MSFAFRGAKSKASGAPLEVIIPSEGIGWDMEATAIIKGTKNLDAAKTLADWSVSEKANKKVTRAVRQVFSEYIQRYIEENTSDSLL